MRLNIVPVENPKGLVVFVHGACARMQQFSHQIDFFHEAGYEILAYDALGCGLSAKPVGASLYSSEELYLDLCAFLKPHIDSNPRTILVGHSMGGTMVLKYASENSVRLAIGIAPALFSGKHQLPANIFKLPRSLLWLIRPLMGLRVREMLFGPKASAELVRQEKEASARNPVHMFRSFYLGINPNFLSVTGKSVILAADQDKVCPLSRFEDPTILRGVGHQCMQEDPDQVNTVLAKLIESITD